MSTGVDDIGGRLAARLRVEREQRGWSLQDFADRSGVSRAMIAKIESGRSSPTAMLLGRLSGALSLTMSALLARAEATLESRLVRYDQQSTWRDPDSGYLRRQLFPVPGSTIPIDMVQVRLPAGAVVPFPASTYAFIRQLIWVLTGSFVFMEGDHEHRLRRGDCLELGPPQDCRFENRSASACSYVVVVYRSANTR